MDKPLKDGGIIEWRYGLLGAGLRFPWRSLPAGQ